MPISPYAKNKVMNDLLSVSFVSLHSKNPKIGGESELEGESYKRVNACILWSPAEDGEKLSCGDICFKELPESKITHVGVWDAEQGGNFLWSAELEETKNVQKGDSFTLPAGQFALGLS